MSEERIISVGELGQGLRMILEENTAGLWIEGEVGRLTRPSSGHLYFTLRDEVGDAVVDCVMYRREALRFQRYLEEGARVQLRGKATYYPPRGRLQWLGEAARPSGQGALLLALQKLKERLQAEGLFAAERKRPLPQHPKLIGVVTSRTGAAWQDICKVARGRASVRIVLSHATVQGESAPDSLIAALERLERLPGLEVLIIGRGGGSSEELAAFNDERVVRKLASFPVPTVSAVGHEIDTSLTDLVADLRAATPSQAAELVVPEQRHKQRELVALKRQLVQLFQAEIMRSKVALGRLERRLGEPRVMVYERAQLLDELRGRLESSWARAQQQRHLEVRQAQQRLERLHPRVVVAEHRGLLAPLQLRLQAALRERMATERGELARLSAGLTGLSPLRVMARGYSLSTKSDGSPIRRGGELKPGEKFRVRFTESTVLAVVEKVESKVASDPSFAHEESQKPTSSS